MTAHGTDVAVVTGGAGGIGLAAARILGSGQPVALLDVSAAALERAVGELEREGVEAHPFVCDITDPASVQDVFTSAAAVGEITRVLHTAGLSPLMAPPERIIEVNALGTVHVVEAAYRAARPGAATALVASMAGHLLPAPLRPTWVYRWADRDLDVLRRRMSRLSTLGPRSAHQAAAYALSKHFTIWYAAQQAARFGERGARILSVSPGSIDTEMGRLEKASGSERMLRNAALKRFGTPDEVAHCLAFATSPHAGYLTGVDLLCDGGTVAGSTLRSLMTMRG